VALGVAVRGPGESDTDMVRSVLQTKAGLVCDEGEPLKVTVALTQLLDEKPPSSTAWFEDKWGSAPPEKDQFNPVAYDTAQGLATLQEQYANFKGDVFDKLRTELKARRLEVRCDQGRKRRAPQDAAWESYQKRTRLLPDMDTRGDNQLQMYWRTANSQTAQLTYQTHARVLPPARLHRPRPRTTKRHIKSITVVSSADSTIDLGQTERWIAAAQTKREAAAMVDVILRKDYPDRASKAKEVRSLAAQFFPDNRAFRTHFQKACGVRD
jgi:hypothetical protein